MKTIFSLTDAGGDRLRVEVPEEKDMMFAACGAVCNVRIGKCEFAPDATQLKRIVRVLRRVVAGVFSANEEAQPRLDESPTLVWESSGPGILRATAGDYLLVVRPSWDHVGKFTGFANAVGQTNIMAGDGYATIEEAQTATIMALRNHLVEMRKRLDAAEALLGGVK